MVAGNPGAGADLYFHRTVPGWKLTPSALIVDDATGKQAWLNAVPRAEVEGWLLIDNRRVPVKGTGYHDHNWGNADMGNSFRGWVWGRAFDKAYTLVYGWIMPLEPERPAQPFVYAARDAQSIFACDNMKMDLIAMARHPKSGKTYPTDLKMSGTAPWGVRLNCRLTMDKLLAWDKDIQSSGKEINYYRRLSHFTADILAEGKLEHASGNALDEYTSLD